MKYSLRKTATPLSLAYRHGVPAGSLLGCSLVLHVDGSLLLLDVDLAANLRMRNRQSPRYLDAIAFAEHHRWLRSVQCPDNLVRGRLARAWKAVENPRMRLRLVLGPRARYLYDVAPHALFTGGIQLDVLAFRPGDSEAAGLPGPALPPRRAGDPHGRHA